MAKIKIAEATALQIDYLVAKALGYTDYPNDSIEHGTIWHTDPDKTPFGRFIEKRYFHPSTNPAQGLPILERERIDLQWDGSVCQAEVEHLTTDDDEYRYGIANGPTTLIAGLRCFLASRLGETAEVPEELI